MSSLTPSAILFSKNCEELRLATLYAFRKCLNILGLFDIIYVTTRLVQYIAYCGISKDAKKVHVH